jgi:hypothetical protein
MEMTDKGVAIVLDLVDQVLGLRGGREEVARHRSGELLSGVG